MTRFRLTAKNNHGSSNELGKVGYIIVEAVNWNSITHEQAKEAQAVFPVHSCREMLQKKSSCNGSTVVVVMMTTNTPRMNSWGYA